MEITTPAMVPWLIEEAVLATAAAGSLVFPHVMRPEISESERKIIWL